MVELTGSVVNIRHGKPFDLYIGRESNGYPESIWGNPFVIGRDGTRAECLDRYRQHILSSAFHLERLEELRGLTLGCWCAPRPCHGDVLLSLLEERDGTRLPWHRASALAWEVVALLAPDCERTIIAGSIRRQARVAGDIELVAVPRVAWRGGDLFGDGQQEVDLLDVRCRELRAAGVVSDRLDVNGRPAFGPKFKRLVYRDFPLDLFVVTPPAQLGVQLLIRTGPSAFSQRVVTPQSRGGLLPDTMLVRDGALYENIGPERLPTSSEQRRKYPAGWLRLIPTPEERDVFEAIGLDYIEPKERV